MAEQVSMVGDAVIEAAGGVVWRPAPSGAPEVLLVHRPKYDDWSLPKGKLVEGESHEDGALREVEEETGYRCSLGPELAGTRYRDRKGRPKTVRYWVMAVVDGAFRPCEEVDTIRWLPVPDARWLLTYERDREVLDSFLRS